MLTQFRRFARASHRRPHKYLNDFALTGPSFPGPPGEQRVDLLRAERAARREELLRAGEHGGEDRDEAVRRQYCQRLVHWRSCFEYTLPRIPLPPLLLLRSATVWFSVISSNSSDAEPMFM